jgi:hypothetical protein
MYTTWDGLSLKTISRYCPFKDVKGLAKNAERPLWTLFLRSGERVDLL